MNAPKILSIQPLENRRLRVTFNNGAEKIYDCTQLFSSDGFRPLADEVFFKTVRVDVGGYGVSWNDKVDLSEYELSVNGV